MEAFDRWIWLAGEHRRVFLEPLREHLARPIQPPDDAAEMVAPVRALVAQGELRKDSDRNLVGVAKEFAACFGFHDPADGDVVGEAHMLVIHLGTAGLLHVSGPCLRPTARLEAAARNPDVLWALLADSLLTTYYVFASQPELAIAAIALRTLGDEVDRAYKDAMLEAILAEDRPTSLDDVSSVAGAACPFTATLCRALRMVPPDSGGVATARFTAGGLRLALRALRAAAHSDDRFTWALEEVGVIARN